MSQLFENLKRRKVFRVGAGYAIVGWLLVEVASVVVPTFEAPVWIMQVFTFLVALGFPLALMLAWAFEVTPEGVVRDDGDLLGNTTNQFAGRNFLFSIIGMLVLGVVFMFVDGYLLRDTPQPPPASAIQASTPEPTPVEEVAEREKSIAVLPFVNMSSDPEQEYFSDGLSEEILNLLAQVSGLKVIGRTSSFAFKGKNEDLRIIGEALDVSTVLEGSVRKAGDRLRITAQLIEVSSGAHLWSGTYDRTLTDIFSVQESVASEILTALQVHVGEPPSRGRPTENPEAYALFLKAKSAFELLEGNVVERLLEEALELDPMFAEAHEMLAYNFWYQGAARENSEQQLERLRDSASKALAINPDLLFASALLEYFDSEDPGAAFKGLEALERLVKEQPNHRAGIEVLGWELIKFGYFRESLTLAERLIELDPLSPIRHFFLYEALRPVGRKEEGIASLKIAAELGLSLAHRTLGEIYLEDQQDELAISHIESSFRNENDSVDWVREMVVGARDPESGEANLDAAIAQRVASEPDNALESTFGYSGLYLSFRFMDRTFEEISEHGSFLSDYLFVCGTIDRRSGFTADPRYLELAKKYGLTKIWDKRGPPDHCKKIDSQWVCE